MDSKEEEYYIGCWKSAARIIKRLITSEDVLSSQEEPTNHIPSSDESRREYIIAQFNMLAKNQHWREEDRKKEEAAARWGEKRAAAEAAKANQINSGDSDVKQKEIK